MSFKFISGKQSSQRLDQCDQNNFLIFDKETQRLEYKDRYNFVVGSQNPKGLQLVPFLKNNMISSNFTFLPEHVGPPNIAHGGVLSAICDDVMGLVCFCLNRISMTLNLTINYRAPVYIGKTTEINAWLVNIDGKKIYCESSILFEDTICVEASGLFYLYDPKLSTID